MIAYLKKSEKPVSDYLGLFSSFICLAHCLVVPALLSIQVMYHTNSASFEILEYFFLFLSFLAVFFSSKKYESFWGKLVMWVTFILFAVSMLQHETIPVFVSYVASLGLITLHLLNIYFKKTIRPVVE